jgi:Carboxypeptidase regulatory-like domain
MKNRVMIYFAGAILVTFLAQSAPVTRSSTASGALHGIVTDPSGAAIPRASVIVAGEGFAQSVATNEAGQYELAGLRPGHYRVEVRSAGFDPFEKDGLVLSAGYETEADAQLAIRATRQEITVTAGSLD